MKRIKYILPVIALLLSGCGQSAGDECTDSKAHLWNSNISDNRYEGNERYWDAVKACEDQQK